MCIVLLPPDVNPIAVNKIYDIFIFFLLFGQNLVYEFHIHSAV